jgi:hypothetical protein
MEASHRWRSRQVASPCPGAEASFLTLPHRRVAYPKLGLTSREHGGAGLASHPELHKPWTSGLHHEHSGQ